MLFEKWLHLSSYFFSKIESTNYWFFKFLSFLLLIIYKRGILVIHVYMRTWTPKPELGSFENSYQTGLYSIDDDVKYCGMSSFFFKWYSTQKVATIWCCLIIIANSEKNLKFANQIKVVGITFNKIVLILKNQWKYIY